MANIKELIERGQKNVYMIVGHTCIIEDDYQGKVKLNLWNYIRAFLGIKTGFDAEMYGNNKNYKVNGGDILPS